VYARSVSFIAGHHGRDRINSATSPAGGRRGRRFSIVGGAAIAIASALIAAPAAFATPSNDDFASAFPVQPIDDHALTNRFEGDTTGATSEPGEPLHQDGNETPTAGGNSVWYTWTAGYTGQAEVDICSHASSSPGFVPFDELLGVYTGSSVMGLTNRGFNIPSDCSPPGPNPGDDIRSQFQAYAGVTYRIAVAGNGGAEGNFFVAVTERAPNDNFARAAPLTGGHGHAMGNNVYALTENGEPRHDGLYGPFGSVWYRWTAPINGRATFNTCGSDFNTALAVYTGSSVGALTPVAKNRNSTTCSPQSKVSFNATKDTVYRIAVDWDTPDNRGGAITLNWNEVRSPQTTITSGPSGTTSDTTPTFAFASSLTGSTFKCRFDARAFGACSGPGASHTPATPLAAGAHTFAVVASKSGAADPTPATRSFTVAP
jgi:hypothetical protein